MSTCLYTESPHKTFPQCLKAYLYASIISHLDCLKPGLLIRSITKSQTPYNCLKAQGDLMLFTSLTTSYLPSPSLNMLVTLACFSLNTPGTLDLLFPLPRMFFTTLADSAWSQCKGHLHKVAFLKCPQSPLSISSIAFITT